MKTRRQFLSDLGKLSLGLALPLPSCSSIPINPDLTIGAVSDIEGSFENARKSSGDLRYSGANLVLIAGDCYENETIRRRPQYPHSKDNREEMYNGLQPFAELKIPMLVIPGNHEEQEVYDDVVKEIQNSYPNVSNVNGESLSVGGINVVGLGGYYDPRFTPRNGFHLSREDYKKAYSQINQISKNTNPTIFLTHSPPRSAGNIDYVKSIRRNVGDLELARIMNSPFEDTKLINVHGHIHEQGGKSFDYPAGTAYNIASVTDYLRYGANTSLFYLKDGKFSHEEITR